MDVINGLHEFSEGTPPTVGVLRLGTGNALAYWLNSSKPSEDLKRWEHPHSHSIIKANMIEAEDTLFPFAGLGMDAAVLNDYNKEKRAAKKEWYKPLMKGMTGYMWAGYLHTLPNHIKTPVPFVLPTPDAPPSPLVRQVLKLETQFQPVECCLKAWFQP